MRISDWSSDLCSSDLVSRSFKHPDFQLAYRELIAFARGLGIDHFAAGIGAVQHARAGHGLQDRRTRYQILISMRFEDMGDLQPFGARHFALAFAIAARIDDRRLAPRTSSAKPPVGKEGVNKFS